MTFSWLGWFVIKYGVICITFKEFILADGYTFSREVEDKKEEPLTRKHVIITTLKSVEQFRDKAYEVLCKISNQIDGTGLCSFDTMCSTKVTYTESPYADLDAVLYYRDLLQQYQPLLQNITLYEEKFDRGTIYDELCKMSSTFISLISTLEYAAQSFIEMGAEPRNITAPDMFFPFPSNDRCVAMERLTKVKQVFRAIKSIWLFSNFMRVNLHERIAVYQAANILTGIETVVHKVPARHRNRNLKKKIRLIEMLRDSYI